MGSATSQARAGIDEALRAQPFAGLEDARELFRATRALEHSSQVLSSLTDGTATPDSRAALADRVLGQLGSPAQAVVAHLARQRWSSADDILARLAQPKDAPRLSDGTRDGGTIGRD